MHSSPLGPAWRRAARGCAAAVLVVLAAGPARAEDTALADPTGVLRIDAPGRWRTQEGDQAIAANGFLAGVKRAELFATLYDDLTSVAAAVKRWQEARTQEGGDPAFAQGEDASRWTAHSAASGTVDYARALDGAGRTAVVWVRLSGAPGTAADDAKALLDAARLVAPETEKPEAPETPDAGADTGAGAKGVGGSATEGAGEHRDADFRIAIHVADGFAERKDVKPAGDRVITLEGPVGTDDEAFLDVYLFDDFDRVDACGRWWWQKERMGWSEGVELGGDVSSFKVEVAGETWTRHVRIVQTEAGIVGVKLDVASQAEKAATDLVDTVLGSLTVLKPKPAVPVAPPGMKTVENATSIVQHELASDAAVKDLQFQADVVEEHVTAISGLEPRDGARAVLRVYKDAAALAAALRPRGVDDGRVAWWWVREGVVLTHAGALETDDAKAALRMELARAALRRRLGFRAPFWIELGIGHMVASAAHNKGRIDQPHPLLVRAVADAAPTGVEHQTVRWWTHENSSKHPERAAVAWSYVHFFLHAGTTGRKWEPSYREYMKRLAATGDPVEASSAFDFARETELAEDWQLWAGKL